MPSFAYEAYNDDGQKVTGSVTALNEREAINVLTGKALFPIGVAAEKTKAKFGVRRVKGQTMAIVYGQLSGLLRSGVPLLRSISVLQEQATNETLRGVLVDIFQHVEDGESLADAMARYPNAFSDMATNLVRAGSEGGFLEEALERVASFTEQQEDLKSRTVGALAYPAFLSVVGTIIVTGLLVFFVPKIGGFFEEMATDQKLPLMTTILLETSDFLKTKGLIIAPVLAFFAAWGWIQAKTDRGRLFVDSWKLRLPILGNIFQSLAVARFCRVLGTLLRNGIPILRSLEISRDAAGNKVLSRAIEAASENITSGESLANPLKASGHFPRNVTEMISVAEESNTLDTVLVGIADHLERQTSRRLDLAVRLIEPILLLLLAGCVLFVVIALLVPIIRISSSF